MSVEAVVDLLRRAERVLFVTGAGVSADSGIPTYRGIGGLYQDRAVEDGRRIEEILSADTYRSDPGLTWRYIAQIEEVCRGVRPNAAHVVIAELEATKEVWVLTQNVDGLHQRAGSTNVIDIHGHIYSLFCPKCGEAEEVDSFEAVEIPPRCACGGGIRPDVVLFDEMLPTDKIATLSSQLSRGFDIVFSIGTSSLFPYIVQPVMDAVERGVPTVEINPDRTIVSGVVDHHLELGAADAMQRIRAAL